HAPYAVSVAAAPPDASQEAAAAAAAHDVLVALYPSFQTLLDDRLQESLAQVPDGSAKDDGAMLGRTVAAQMIALRVDDGSSDPPTPFTFGSNPGDYQSTPPNFPPHPQFTHWSAVRPFALSSASQFRPGPPPRVTSRAYRAALGDVASLGVVDGS